MNNKVVVTGGAGFIGSHTSDLLISKGYRVYILDNLSTGKMENVNKKAEFIKINIVKDKKLYDFIKSINPCAVIHLAAWPRIMRSVDEPIETNEINVNGTLAILEASKNAKIKRFVFSSSSSVYGDQIDYKMKEIFVPNPKSLYALQKLISEKYCDFYAKSYGMEVVSLRYFSVYGNRQPDTGVYALVIGKFIRQLRDGKYFTVYGDGEQTRDYTHVSDVARANLLSIKSKIHKSCNTVLNIGTSKETSVNQLVSYFGGNAKYIVPNPREKYEEKRKVADITKAKRILRWSPQIELKKALVEILKK